MKSRVFSLTLIVAAVASLAWIAIPRLNLSRIVGAYAGFGLLAIAACDYSSRQRGRREACRPAPMPLPIRNPDTWTCQTISA